MLPKLSKALEIVAYGFDGDPSPVSSLPVAASTNKVPSGLSSTLTVKLIKSVLPYFTDMVSTPEFSFEYKTVAFVWDKMNHNPGQYTLSNCELCLLFKKGKIPRPRGARNVQQLVRVPRGKHSEKPIEVLKKITLMFPTQDKIELFARKTNEGWDNWGLDVLK